MQVPCFAITSTTVMARLSLGSQHFQTGGRRSTLITESATRAANLSINSAESDVDSHGHESVQTEMEHKPAEADSNLEIVELSSTKLINETETKYSRIETEIADLIKTNKDLLRENSKLKEENGVLRSMLEEQKANVETIVNSDFANELESTVMSSFAKILDKILKLKELSRDHTPPKPIDRVISPQKKEKAIVEVKREAPGLFPPFEDKVEERQDNRRPADNEYPELTFFQPINRRPNARKNDSLFSVQRNMPASHLTIAETDVAKDTANPFETNGENHHDNNTPTISFSDKLKLNRDDEVVSSTPRKRPKKNVLLDFYGDEIILKKKKHTDANAAYDNGNTKLYPDKDIASEGHLKDSSNRNGHRRALSNITNKKKVANEKLKLIPAVESNFFDYVDENILTEQTQKAVKQVKDIYD